MNTFKRFSIPEVFRLVAFSVIVSITFTCALQAKPEDPKKHVKRQDLHEKAISGDVESMHGLGNYYLRHGETDLAIEWFRKAGEKYYIPSLWRLGNLPRLNWSKSDYLLAKKSYEQLIVMQEYKAFSFLGDLHADKKAPYFNLNQAVLYYKDGVKQRDVDAMVKLARFYMGLTGHKPQFILAIPHLNEAVELYNPQAMRLLGKCHRFGLGVVVNKKKGWEYYFKAAQFGDPKSMLEIAEALYSGEELEQDIKLAKIYFKRSAVHGNIKATVRIEEIEAETKKKDKPVKPKS